MLYLLTFISIPTLALYKPAKDDAGAFVLGAGSTAGLQWSALSEVAVGLAGIGTAVVLYRSGLVPRIFPIVAFVGAPLLLASDIAVFFGTYAQVSPIAALAALPVAAFELSLGVWLIVKGFKPAPPTAGGPSTRRGRPDTQRTVQL